MRIGVDGRYLQDAYPGIARYVFHLTQALAEALPEDDRLVLLHGENGATRCEARALQGPRLERQPLALAPRSLAEQWRFAGATRALKLDVLLSPYPFTAWRVPLPRVCLVYDLIPLHPRYGLRSAWARGLARVWLRAVLRRSRRVLTPTRAVQAELQRQGLIAAGQGVVIGAAPPPGCGPVSIEEVRRERERLGVDGACALFVGSAQRHKGLELLLAAWSRLETRWAAGPQPWLLLAGAAPHDLPVRRARVQAWGLRRVRVVPPCHEHELNTLYTLADVLVAPSEDEGVGLPLLEAMACGTPVLCSDTAALRESAGGAARHLAARTPTAWCAELEQALAGGAARSAWVERGRAHAQAHTWSAVAERVLPACRAALVPPAHGWAAPLGARADTPSQVEVGR